MRLPAACVSALALACTSCHPTPEPVQTVSIGTASAPVHTTVSPSAPDAGRLDTWALAFNTRDAHRMALLYSEDAVAHDASRAFRGRADIERELRTNTFAISHDVTLGLGRVFFGRNEVICEWTMSGTNDGEVGRMRATGKRFAVKGASRLVFDAAGLVSEEWSIGDSITLAAQIGMFPAAEVPPLADPARFESHAWAQGDAAQSKNLRVVEESLEKEREGKLADAFALYADDAVGWSNIFGAADRVGRVDLEDEAAERERGLSDLKVAKLAAWATDGDYVAALLERGGTVSASVRMWGRALALPAGQRVTLTQLFIYRLKDGKISRMWSYADSAQVLAPFMPK